jgi:hypothetical protein
MLMSNVTAIANIVSANGALEDEMDEDDEGVSGSYRKRHKGI